MGLSASGITFSYPGGAPVLKGVSISVARAERVALGGPSGAGKTTLAKILSGVLAPQAGEVLVDGEPPRSRRARPRPAQMIWQHPEQAVDSRLRMWRTLAEGQGTGARASGRSRVCSALRATETLERLGIRDEWLTRWPHELSGGELMRCCIARALLAHPRYLICDEMTAMLDAVTQAEIWRAVVKIAEERDMGLVVISHSAALLARVADRRVSLA